MDVFVLHHTYGPDEEESNKLLGVFSSQVKAEKARAGYLNLPGFKDHPDGYSISLYTVDRRHWIEGFVGSDEGIFDAD